MKCIICNEDAGRFGNNALPIKNGKCCDACNRVIVIPTRLENLRAGKSIYGEGGEK